MRFIVFLALLFTLWAGGFLLFVMDAESLCENTAQHKALLKKSGAIIVLTGAKYRIKEGLKLLESKAAPRLLISGVLTHISKPKIVRLSGFRGSVPLKKIELDYESKTTAENAHYSARWIQKHKLKRVHILTSSYHMRRALVEFHHKLPGVSFIPHAISPLKNKQKPWDSSQKNLVLYLTEYTKYLVAYIKNIVPL